MLTQGAGGIAEAGLAETAPLFTRAPTARFGMKVLESAVVAGYGAEPSFPGAALTVF